MQNQIIFITVHLNNSQSFIKTAESLRLLPVEYNWNWLIKDGLSTCSEIDLLRELIQTFPSEKVTLVERPDNGIYDAMNQALSLLTSDDCYCLFLNAGDYLIPQFYVEIKNIIDNYHQFDIIYYDHIHGIGSNAKLKKSPERLDFGFLLGKTINHQSLFIRLKWLKKYPFDSNYSVVADWIQLFSILKNENVKIKYVNVPMINYEGGGYSEKNDHLRLEERRKFLKSHYSDWELESLHTLSRLSTRPWLPMIIRALGSPSRSALLSIMSKFL
jgi:hypothetical protein